MTDTIKALPAYDPTGKLDKLLFRDPVVWNPLEKEYTKQWNRVAKGG